MSLALALLALVGLTHFGPDWIALAYPQRDAAARAWFYMLRGVEGVALFAIIASGQRAAAALPACLLGMFEEGMTAACRASKPIGGALGYEPFSGLCGPDWYRIGLALFGLVALAFAYELGRVRRHGKKRP